MEEKVVVDACIIVKWFIEGYSDEALRLRNDYIRGNFHSCPIASRIRGLERVKI